MYAIISPHPSQVPAFKACSEAESAKQYSKQARLRGNLLQSQERAGLSVKLPFHSLSFHCFYMIYMTIPVTSAML